jgi:YrbI family 3-deoxy-D-manno-octulosonate 8-phosphate phosphatase
MNIKLILTDIDGVWTDGSMYYSEKGDELKKFNTSDSAGILFAKVLNIKTGIITGENTKLVEWRSNKLKIDFLFQGVSNKLNIATELVKKLGLDFSEVAYIGDDIADVPLLRVVEFSACPNDAPEYVKSEVKYVLKKNGGDGVFREFVELMLTKTGTLNNVINGLKNV